MRADSKLSRFDMNDTLWKRNFDSVAAKRGVNVVVEPTPELVVSWRVVAPDQELEVERRIPKFVEPDFRRWMLQDMIGLGSHLVQNARDQSHVGAIGHADRNVDPDPRISVRPVGDGLIDELGVGNDDGNVVVGDDCSGAEVDVDDVALDILDGNPIVDPNRLLEQEDQSRHEVGDDIL